MEMEGERVGFRFYPIEEELISFYLQHKIDGNKNKNKNSKLQEDIDRVIPLLHVYDFNPWDLPQYAGERCQGDVEQWFFFIPRQEKEARGGRPCRLTNSGYWKATGSPSVVYSSINHRGIGMKRTMVFYIGRAPYGKKTHWKMNEYKAFQQENNSSNTNLKLKLVEELSLCRVYVKSKCMRAFDRRPSGVLINESSRLIQQSPQDNEHYAAAAASSSSHHNHAPIIDRTTSSPDHSSNSSTNQTTNDSHSTIEMDNQLLWDWEEHLNWF